MKISKNFQLEENEKEFLEKTARAYGLTLSAFFKFSALEKARQLDSQLNQNFVEKNLKN